MLKHIYREMAEYIDGPFLLATVAVQVVGSESSQNVRDLLLCRRQQLHPVPIELCEVDMPVGGM